MLSSLTDKYGSMDEFIKLYRNGKLKGHDLYYAESTIKTAIDLDKDEEYNYYDELMKAVFKNNNEDLILYSGKELNSVLKRLMPVEYTVLEKRYGLKTGKKITLEKTAENSQVSREGVRQIEQRALRSLKVLFRKSNAIYNSLLKNEYVNDNEKERIENFFEQINNSNIIFKTNREPNISEGYMAREVKFMNNVRDELLQRKEEKRKQTIKKSNTSISIKKLNLTNRPTNALQSAGIHTLDDLVNLTGKEFCQIKGIGVESVEEVVDKLIELGLSFKPEELTNLEKARSKKYRLQKRANELIEKAEKARQLSEELDGNIVKKGKEK